MFLDESRFALPHRTTGLGLRVSLKPLDNKGIYGFSFPHPVADTDVEEATKSAQDGLWSG